MCLGTRGDARSLRATLLIPANRLDAALPSLKAIGFVLEESQGGDDVTEQVVDVEARLSNARNTEKRLVDLLQKRTGDLADVLAAEREIARVREEIERSTRSGRTSTPRDLRHVEPGVMRRNSRASSIWARARSGRFRDAFVAGLTDAPGQRRSGSVCSSLRAGPLPAALERPPRVGPSEGRRAPNPPPEPQNPCTLNRCLNP